MSAREATDVGMELAGRNIGVELMKPIPIADAQIQNLGRILSDRHLAWQSRSKGGIDEQYLVDALNRTLELDSADEYMAFRTQDVKRVRTSIWVQVPELSTGTARATMKTESAIFQSTMSPFEAFLAADTLVYLKLSSDDFMRTASEEFALRGLPKRITQPGLRAGNLNPRRMAFMDHLRSLTKEKSQSPDDVVAAVRGVLEGTK